MRRIVWEGEEAIQRTFIDLTDRKGAERALHDSEARFRALAENTAVGIFETDPEGRCIHVNERGCEIAGLSKDEELGDGWTKAIHPEDGEMVFEE